MNDERVITIDEARKLTGCPFKFHDHIGKWEFTSDGEYVRTYFIQEDGQKQVWTYARINDNRTSNHP